MKYIVGIVFLLLICSNKIYAQVVHVSNDTLFMIEQDRDIIPCEEHMKIVVTDVVYDKETKNFGIKGFINNFSENPDSSVIKIDLIRKGKMTHHYSYTKAYGAFDIKMCLRDSCLFYGDYGEIYYKYITIKQPKKWTSRGSRVDRSLPKTNIKKCSWA